MAVLFIRTNKELLRRLEAEAKIRGESVSEYTRRILSDVHGVPFVPACNGRGRFIPESLIQEFAERRKSGLTWEQVAEVSGYDKNSVMKKTNRYMLDRHMLEEST